MCVPSNLYKINPAAIPETEGGHISRRTMSCFGPTPLSGMPFSFYFIALQAGVWWVAGELLYGYFKSLYTQTLSCGALARLGYWSPWEIVGLGFNGADCHRCAND